MKNWFLLSMLFTSCIMFIGGAMEPDMDAKLADAKEFFRMLEYKKSEKILDIILKDKKVTNETRLNAMILQARNYVKLDKKADAEKLVSQIKQLNKNDFIQIQLGELFLDMENYNGAIDCTKSVMSGTASNFKAESIYLRARAEFELGNYLGTMQLCDDFSPMVAKAKKEAEERDTFSVEQVRYLDNYYPLVEALQERAKDAYETKRYGIDYVYYRKGRNYQFKKKWKDAIEAYAQISMHGVLKEAGTYYTIQCMADADNDLKICYVENKKCNVPPWKHAIKMYEDFIDVNPNGLYREEAYLGLAELLYRHGDGNGNAKKALDVLDKYFKMLEELKKSEQQTELLKTLNTNVISDFVKKNPAQFTVENEVGQLVRTLQRPESIINRLTAPWYSIEKETRALLLQGFLLGQIGDKINAARAYDQARKLGLKKILCSEFAFDKLMAGLCDSSYMLPKNVKMSLLRKNIEIILPFAAFLHITDREQEANSLLNELLKPGDKALAPYELITLKLVEAQFKFSDGKNKDAEKILCSFYAEKKAKKLPHWPMMAFLYANCLGMNGQKNKACEVYNEIIESGSKKSEYTPLSMLALAAYATNCGDKETAIKCCNELIKKYSKTGYKVVAQTLRLAIKKASDGEIVSSEIGNSDLEGSNEPENKDYKPRVVNANKIIVIPDNQKWKEDFNDLKKSDIVLYNVKFINRDSCATISGVSVQYSLDEPQIPAAKGNFLTYVRLPFIFEKSLRYDFAKLLTGNTDNSSNANVDENGEFVNDP